jgi:hypothetical protein
MTGSTPLVETLNIRRVNEPILAALLIPGYAREALFRARLLIVSRCFPLPSHLLARWTRDGMIGTTPPGRC